MYMIAGIIEAITQTFTGVASAFGTMVVNLFTSLFIQGEGLSNLGAAGICFFAIGLILSVFGTVLGILKIRKRSRRVKRSRK